MIQPALFEEPRENRLDAPVLVIGVGGAGCRAASELWRRREPNLDVLCVDTDSRALDRSPADRSMLLGAAVMRGFGSGSNRTLAEIAVRDQRPAVSGLVRGRAAVVLLTGLSGGTGGGASTEIAGIARSAGVPVLSVAMLPFEFEPPPAQIAAMDALERLHNNSDALYELSTLPGESNGQPVSSTLSARGRRCTDIVVAIARASEQPGDFPLSARREPGSLLVFGTAVSDAAADPAALAVRCLDDAHAGRPAASTVISSAALLVEAPSDYPAKSLARLVERFESAVAGAPGLNVSVRTGGAPSNGRVSVSLVGRVVGARLRGRALLADARLADSPPSPFAPAVALAAGGSLN